MEIIKKYKDKISELIFLLAVFVISINPLVDFDIWFHLKSGEIIAKYGIIHTDVFAYTTSGREWIPFEWLFQLTVYYFSKFLGLESITYLIAVLSTVFVFITYAIFRKIFDLGVYKSLFISFILYASIYELLNPRPQIFAYIFFALNLLFILLYFLKNKNYLFLTLPITLAWANLHGSIFIDIGLFIFYAFNALINLFLLKDKVWLKKFKTLLAYSVITIILTILPPLGFTQYRLLWMFYQNRETITRFIAEWAPLSADPTPFIFYTFLILLTFGLFTYSLFKTKKEKNILWLLPFVVLVFTAFLAVRNTFFGYFGMSMLIAYSVSKINFNNFSKNIKRLFILIILIFLIFFIWLLYDKKTSVDSSMNYYPVNAVTFIKQNNLKGHMFNEYGFGGYLLYELYPQQKVYFDGRSDLFLCCEMPETLEFSYQKHLPNNEYKKILDKFWNKNDISFVILRTEKNTVLRKIETILQSDPNWSLVFWDDATVIFIKRDGKNRNIIEKFGTTAATPYDKNPYRKDMETEAFKEYTKMIKTADSSKSRNTLGYLYLLKSDLENAKHEFKKAIEVYPYNESPYMNLAEIYFKENDPEQAIKLYEQAKKLAPDRGLIYIRLGQIVLASSQDRGRAISIWQEGLKNTADEATRQQLQELIQQY